MQFYMWSLGRSGLSCLPTRKVTLHNFMSALLSKQTGLPRPVLQRTRLGSPSYARCILIGVEFYSADLFRCSFSLYIPY